MFYYGRRIGRPNYLIMNPFEYYQDEFTLKKGNPNLRPEFINAFELTYGLYNKYFISLNYHYTENKIGDLEYRGNDLTYITFDNLDTQQNLSLNIYSQFNIFKWWNSIFNFRPSYQKFESTNYERDNFNLFLSSQNYIALNDNLNLEITSKFSSKGYDRYYRQEQNLFDLSIGVDHSLFQKRASLNYGLDNLFYTWRGNLKSSIDYAGQNNFIHSKWDTRLFYLGFKYYFKSGEKFKKTSKETSNKTEKRRQ
ncbi:MAG: outer membrane beta-barrel protein, partial [Flavobacteriales bacterium]